MIINNWTLIRIILSEVDPGCKNLERYIGPVRDITDLRDTVERSGLLSALQASNSGRMRFLGSLYFDLVRDIQRIENYQELLVVNDEAKEKIA